MSRLRDIRPALNSLHVFEAAARHLSFTRAATQLGMAQPSVSRFIGNLEQFLGKKLFHRLHNRLELTEAGVALFRATELGLGHIRTVMETLVEEQGTQRLSIACTHGFAHMWIMPRLEALQALLPSWDVRMNTSDLAQGAEFDEADLVIRFGKGDWPWLTNIKLFEEEVFPVCASGYLENRGLDPNSITIAELSQLPLLAQDHGEFSWLSWHSWFKAHGFDIPYQPPLHPIPSYHFILQSATEAEGVALAWEHLIEPYRSNGWLAEIPDFRVQTGNGYYATFASDHPQADVISKWLKRVLVE